MRVDLKASERGRQRRKAGGRLLHCCCICSKVDVWGKDWSVYCSVRELDDEEPVPKFCSIKCKNKGGVRASNVTDAMKQSAKDAEWRDPKLVYREATEAENYRDALERQRDRR